MMNASPVGVAHSICDFLAEVKEERNDLINPYWLEDKDLRKGIVDYLPEDEVIFFRELIDKYLQPMLPNKQREVNCPSWC